ncbi:hypothetical protein QZH41_018684 [Actinostola sp. cb2023]|nr:hypothetical protein QZH41_018684 [Actinostola sp. cb2023]
MFTDYLDSAWAMGSSTFELVRGVDCPESATFVDLIHHVDTPRPRRIKNAVCIFEFNTGIALRRHFENDLRGGYEFYGGMPSYALVLRYVSTPYNYDYMFDYIFYNNGVVEVRVATSGYIQATYWTAEESSYGQEVHKDVAGTIHDHLFNYKVDLDVAVRKNSYQTIDFERETIVNPWFPSLNRTQKVVRRRTKNTEQEALYKYNFDHPKYLNFFSETNLTKTGLPRGYRIQLRDVMKQIYPESLPLMNSAKWSLHQLVVTKYKENETCSSSMYNQIDPYSPEVDFQTFYADNENIRNEDLVAWVTVGLMHVPHTEDMPNTASAGNTASFFLRPYNFFEEDPSMGSSDAVLIKPKDKKFSGFKVERFGTPDGPTCMPTETPFEFTGTRGFD